MRHKRVAKLIRHFITDPDPCPYLPDRQARLEYRVMVEVGPEELEGWLARGWRRFGPAYFRPACGGCQECVPLRVSVENFRPSKSQRRVMRKVSEQLHVQIGPPRVDDQRLALYHRWHAARRAERGWPDGRIDPEDYRQQFAYPHEAARELGYFTDQGELVAVAITDETPNSLSAIYTFFSPDFAAWSPGTMSVLFQLRYAAVTGKRWLYLGYRIQGCPSSRYKAHFRPHQLLPVLPEPDVAPRWVPADPPGPAPAPSAPPGGARSGGL